MSYIVVEIQKSAQGTVSTIVTQHADRYAAEAKYHAVLAAAAVSSVAQHGAVLLTDTGMEIMHQCYVHEPAPEPEEE